MFFLVLEIGKDEYGKGVWYVPDLTLDVLVGPLLTQVNHEDGTMSPFVHVDRLGIKGREIGCWVLLARTSTCESIIELCTHQRRTDRDYEWRMLV
jgi:hypothetical protein